MRIIYDFGAHNGNDIPYYLSKADKVVAVDANEELVLGMRNRFADQISQGKLVVEHCALVTTDEKTVDFYIHSNDVLSSLKSIDDGCVLHRVPARNVVDLVAEHGNPYYIKIDIEFFDHIILECLLKNNIKPQYISAEAHNIDVFCLLVAIGGYDKFKLVDGRTVNEVYPEFEFHAAGPFGEDIHGEWMDKNTFFDHLAKNQLGWKDIHATFNLCV